MDLLDKVSTMSIAELRKVLSDNNVKDLSTNKEDLISQVGEVLLTQLTIHSMDTNETVSDKPRNRVVKDPRTIEREKQDQEYMDALQYDKNGNYIIEQPDMMPINTPQQEEFEELPLELLREQRMLYYKDM
jgi:hypothetical protein